MGIDPDDACTNAIKRIVRHYPDFSGAVVAATINGTYGKFKMGTTLYLKGDWGNDKQT